MKRLKIFFLLLLGFLFVSIAEAKTDFQVNDGFEVVINTVDFDLMVIDNTTIETPLIYSNCLVINVCRDVTIKSQKTKLSESVNLLKKQIAGTKAQKITFSKKGRCLDTGELSEPYNYMI